MESTKTRIPAVFLMLALVVLSASCGGGSGEADFETTNGTAATSKSGEERASKASGASESGLTPAEATVGPEENSSMLPAGGGEPDPAQPPPENPPEGVKTYPATTNGLVEGEVDYERTPPTNGDHGPLWQNCGFYPEPVRDENAVHSLDHGAVWITYGPDLPQRQVDTLRSYSDEEYVLVSPYPDQPAPVTVTAWRNQLRLEEAGDPRLDQFVEQFRISQTAPLSGNGCSGGTGSPV
ncbi:DUF3105 domain-containing protein [Rubrobacter aplysinae]|uniref:DUF3105 domain-containing protein n=1 Tax=Rubrobacter aplysinae TaxID=909625 RepID=UPI00069FBEC1|nr:DUF3105 domain-containing protein [Rubrobacter aplysinae]